MNELSLSQALPLSLEIIFDGHKIDKPWLIDIHPSTVHLAGGKPDLQFERCEIYLGNRPIAIDFQRIAIDCLKERISRVNDASQKEGGDGGADMRRLEEVRKLRPYWNYYLILYGLGISRCDRRLSEVRLQLDYEDSPERPVTILDYWPKGESKDIARVGGSVRFDLDVNGRLSASEAILDPVLKAIPLPFVTIREPAEHLLQEGACSKQ